MLYSYYLEIERLIRKGEILLTFWYAWQLPFLRQDGVPSKQVQMVECFLTLGANPNNRGLSGMTGLMMACLKRHDHLVLCFLKHGANVNQQDFTGRSALHYALLQKGTNPPVKLESFIQEVHIIEILLQHKADPYLKNSSGLSAMDMARRGGLVVVEKLMIHHAGQKDPTGCNIL